MNPRSSRLFDHVVLQVRDLRLSKIFYGAIVETLGHTITREDQGQFFIHELEVREANAQTQGVHLAFYAESPGSVKLFHETALRSGGKCAGAPAIISETGVYSAHVIDPDGNRIEAVYKTHRQSFSTISY